MSVPASNKPRPGYEMILNIDGEEVCATNVTFRGAATVLDGTCGPIARHGYGVIDYTGNATVTIDYETTEHFEQGQFFDGIVIVPPFQYIGSIGIDNVEFSGSARGGLTQAFDYRFSDDVVKEPYPTPP
jgi:hypothetical protein